MKEYIKIIEIILTIGILIFTLTFAGTLIYQQLFAKRDRVCVKMIADACFLDIPFICLRFADPCSVPPLWKMR